MEGTFRQMLPSGLPTAHLPACLPARQEGKHTYTHEHTHTVVSFYGATRLQSVDTNAHSPLTNGIWHVQSTMLPNPCS